RRRRSPASARDPPLPLKSEPNRPAKALAPGQTKPISAPIVSPDRASEGRQRGGSRGLPGRARNLRLACEGSDRGGTDPGQEQHRGDEEAQQLDREQDALEGGPDGRG